MNTLSKNFDFSNMFNEILENILSNTSEDILSVSNELKNNMLSLGAKIFQQWLQNKIDAQKTSNTFFSKDEKKRQYYKFSLKEYHKKVYLSAFGEIILKRGYYSSKWSQKGYYPVDDKCSFLKNYCLPDAAELICYTTCQLPYDSSQAMLLKLANVNISTSKIINLTGKIGNKLIEIEENSINETPVYSKSKKKIDRMVISMDGAMIHTNEDWKEVKTGIIYEVKGDNDNLISFNKSYVSKIEDADSFSKRIKREAYRRCYRDAKELIVIGDGAKWIWNIAEREFPHAVKIVDWYHAVEHIHKIADHLYNHNDTQRHSFADKCKDYLYNGEIRYMCDFVNAEKIRLNIVEPYILSAIETEKEYFSKNTNKMQYKAFENNGYPIGSGNIEAACKQLVQLRLKRNGMIWKKDGAHCVLEIRCKYLSNRWSEVQDVIKSA